MMPSRFVRQVLPDSAFTAIERAIGECEASHGGQIRFAVEAALALNPLWRGQSARERAIEVFAELRVWDTADNNGVLIYLLLADHDVEIVADRGIDAKVGGAEWERICREMEQSFISGRFEDGVIAGIRAVSAHLQRHYPHPSARGNELPDEPVVI
jgi:uncharacterized membrane protein